MLPSLALIPRDLDRITASIIRWGLPRLRAAPAAHLYEVILLEEVLQCEVWPVKHSLHR